MKLEDNLRESLWREGMVIADHIPELKQEFLNALSAFQNPINITDDIADNTLMALFDILNSHQEHLSSNMSYRLIRYFNKVAVCFDVHAKIEERLADPAGWINHHMSTWRDFKDLYMRERQHSA